MKLPGEDEQKPMGFSVIYMVIGVSAFVLILLLSVMKNNKKEQDRKEYVQNAAKQEEMVQPEEEIAAEPEQKLRAEDLSFWDMYPVEEEKDKTQASRREDEENTTSSDTKNDEDKSKTEEEQKEVVQEDPSTDGKHTLIKHSDGTEEWVLISPYLTKNTYDFTNMSETANLRKYTDNGKKISYMGVDISKHNGNVNFRSMKAAGIDYVMIRLGARGYSTGQISLDDNFVQNIEAAIDAEMDIGVYFYSQAVTLEEVTQEANFVVQNLAPYKEHINYPVAFDMENVSNDKARIDGLSREDKTAIAAAFLSGVQAAGYTPMIYGNKEWLIKNIDLAQLQNYDVWLSQDEDIPDYPYQYTMWQYTTTGVLNGITGDANLNLCFVSYSDR
ncbi:MAG: glycoside hydrolase family 25 protein [Bacillus sp. (in: Bacteria)]|nr:glycoside hydrolase family 25 protein [Bacillus sp. (in: firmicutes)]MCM1424995.1 glycoside hydrolase family 25 protein [Eubacterium sp.]